MTCLICEHFLCQDPPTPPLKKFYYKLTGKLIWNRILIVGIVVQTLGEGGHENHVYEQI